MRPAMNRRRARLVRGSGRRQAGAVVALALTCAGCGHILPLGLAPSAPRQLASAITLQLVLSQPLSPGGGCPAGYATLPAPFADYPEVPNACFRKTGEPVTITSAAVAMSYQPAVNQQPAQYGLTFTVSAAEAAALTAITARAFESRDPVAVSTAGQTWNVTMTGGPLAGGQFGIWVQSENQVLQLQRILIPPA
jgi:hypothetical protein